MRARWPWLGLSFVLVTGAPSCGDRDGGDKGEKQPEDDSADDPFACADQDLESALGDGVATGSTAGAGNAFDAACDEGGGRSALPTADTARRGDTGSGFQSTGEDVHFKWTPPATGCYDLSTLGSDYDTVIYVLASGCSGAVVACNDDAVDLDSKVTVQISEVSPLLIVVDAYTESEGGNYVLNIEQSAAANAEDLGSETGLVASGDNSAGEVELETACASLGSGLAFRWTAPSAGSFTIDSFGSDFDTVLLVGSGDGCGIEGECNDDTEESAGDDGTQSAVTVTAAEGEAFSILIGGYDGETGNYVLNITAS